jgi:hypothetical protein
MTAQFGTERRGGVWAKSYVPLGDGALAIFFVEGALTVARVRRGERYGRCNFSRPSLSGLVFPVRAGKVSSPQRRACGRSQASAPSHARARTCMSAVRWVQANEYIRTRFG